MTHGDLFAGIGGFALAAQWCGIKTIWAVEIDPYCQAVYRKHFPDVEMYGDVKEIVADAQCERREGGEIYQGNIIKALERRASDSSSTSGQNDRTGIVLSPVDLLTGGFPCQPFSVAGKRRGKADDRYLWPEMLRIIRAVHPRWVIAENVPGIDDATNMVLDTVTSDLEGIGYAAIPIEIPACAVGAPHRRQRVWVVATNCNCTGLRQQAATSTSKKSDWRAEACIVRSNWWSTEPDVGVLADGLSLGLDVVDLEGIPFRVAKGIPERVNQLRALGNAIVPQVAERIMRAILESEP